MIIERQHTLDTCPRCLGNGWYQGRDRYGALDELPCSHITVEYRTMTEEEIERARKEQAFQDWEMEQRLERYWAEHDERGGDEP